MGFFSKQMVLSSAIQNGYYFISIIAILTSVISAYYYLQIIKVMHFDTINNIEVKSVNNNSSLGLEINSVQSYIIAALTLSLLLFLLNPSILLNSIHLIALNIFIY